MRKLFVCKLVAAAMVAGCVFWAQLAWADSGTKAEPIAVGSFCGYDGMFENIGTIGKVSGNPDLAVGLEAMLKLVTRSHGLDGLDKSKPWGAAVYLNGKKPSGYVFLPVTDLQKLLAILEPFVGKAEDAGDGVLKISGKKGKAEKLFVKQKGSWAIISKKQENLALACDNPAELLGDLPEKYDLAISINALNIPADLREKVVEKIKKDAAKDMKRRDGEDDIEHSVRCRVTKDLLAAITGAVNDISRITAGWTLDNKTEKIHADVTVLAKPGSETARQLTRWSSSKTRFAGFRMTEAVWAGSLAGDLNDNEADTLKAVLKAVHDKGLQDIEKKDKPKSHREAAAGLLGDIYNAFNEVVGAKRIDSAAALLFEPGSLTLLDAEYAPNPRELEKIAGKISDIILAEHPELNDVVTIKPDVEEHEGVRFHSVSLKIPPDAKNREKVVALIGETCEVILGVGNDSIYMAAGREPLATLKKAIAASTKDLDSSVPPAQMSIGMRSLAGLLAEISKTEKEQSKMATLAKLLETAGDKDHIVLSAVPVENGLSLRFEVEEGIIKTIGKMSTMLPSSITGVLAK
ncbi:MAG: hypothetical protein JXM70_17175 [Pirellulales bacterium]|nr:hypothetical protein [Pirellulales bacterium]